MLFVFCAPKKTTVKTEGLEEVIVFGEEKPPAEVTEPVLPAGDTVATETVAVVPPPIQAPPIIEETPPPVAEEVTPPVVEETATTPSPQPSPTTQPTKVFGFRIQIFASSTEQNALKVADDAKSVFTEKVYVEYVAPYYKVRVGNCLTREDAEALRGKAVKQGYQGAFIVETIITP